MSERLSEIDFRLLTHAVVLRVPERHRAQFAARFVTPADQPAPVRDTWAYGVSEDPDGRWALHEGGDRFDRAGDVGQAAERLEQRITARALDYLSRWGWLVVAGSVVEVDGRRILTIGRADGSLALLRDGEAVALPLPLPCSGPVPGRGRLTDLAVVGAPTATLATPAALSALLATARPGLPGGPRAAVRQATAALRGVRAHGVLA